VHSASPRRRRLPLPGVSADRDPANADPVCDKSPHHELVINVARKAAIEREPDSTWLRFAMTAIHFG
jgi:hypothetical protein